MNSRLATIAVYTLVVVLNGVLLFVLPIFSVTFKFRSKVVDYNKFGLFWFADKDRRYYHELVNIFSDVSKDPLTYNIFTGDHVTLYFYVYISTLIGILVVNGILILRIFSHKLEINKTNAVGGRIDKLLLYVPLLAVVVIIFMGKYAMEFVSETSYTDSDTSIATVTEIELPFIVIVSMSLYYVVERVS